MKKNNIQFVKFAALPEFKRQKNKGDFYSYGYNNKLAYELIELYNNSSKHNAITSSKINYITGEGLSAKDADAATKQLLLRPNQFETSNELLEKITTDLEIQGGYYLQLVFGKIGGKLTDVYHLPFEKMMPNEDATFFRYTPDKLKPSEYTDFEAFNEDDRTGTKVLYISTYSAGSGVLTLPTYYASLKYIKIDAEIANFNLNNIRSGFSAGTMIVLYNGEPTDEEENAIAQQLKDSTTGSDNAGNVWLYFAKQGEQKPELIPLNGNDLVDRFAQLNEQTRDEIFIGHKVVSPMLFGVRVEGQLGGRNEMLQAFELFSNGYIKPQQQKLTSTFNLLARLKGGQGGITIKESTPIGIDLLEIYREGLITDRAFMQKKLGIPIDRPIEPQTQLSSQENLDHVWNDNDWIRFIDYGLPKQDFEIIKEMSIKFDANNIPVEFNEIDDKILQAIKDNPMIDVASLINSLNITAKEGAERLGILIEQNLIDPTRGLQITPQGNLAIQDAPATQFFVKYEYSGPQDNKNRAFCARLLQLDRLYTREDINQLSRILGYNVWLRRGGWYHNPKLNVNTPYCRHTWKQIIVKKRI